MEATIANISQLHQQCSNGASGFLPPGPCAAPLLGTGPDARGQPPQHPPRALITNVLARADGHLTADAIHERATAAGSVNLSTVYRTLALFERLHIVHTLALGGRVIYGLADAKARARDLGCRDMEITSARHRPEAHGFSRGLVMTTCAGAMPGT